MTDSMTLTVTDNGSDATVAAERVVAWVRAIKGSDADAHIVYDYIPVAGGAIPGALNGVTVQWAHVEAVIQETPEREPNIVAPVASEAVHVRPGQTITHTKDGFEVSE